MLNEYRAFARPQKLDLQPTNLGQLVEEVLASHIRRYNASHVQINLDFEPELPPMKVDPIKIKQTILNVCQNAVEAMPNGGTLSIKAYRQDSTIIIEVSDSGSGIPEGFDVFQIFNTTKPQGTGLGLPTVQQIISEHGGTVDYTSALGRGTTFRIVLPMTATSDFSAGTTNPAATMSVANGHI
jgi:signal transduction histidine kinase